MPRNRTQPPLDPNDASPLAGKQAFLEALLTRGKATGKITFSKTEETSLVQHVLRDFQDGFGENQLFRQNMVEMNENWRGSTSQKDFPFEDCANVRVPFTSVMIEQMKARIMKALFGSKLICEFTSLDKVFSKEQLDDYNLWFLWELLNTVKLKPAMRGILHYLLLYGFALPIATYETTTTELRSFRRSDLSDPNAVEQVLSDALAKIVTDVPGDSISESTDYGVYSLAKGGTVRFSARESSGEMELVAEVRRPEIVFDGVKIQNPQLEDVVIINSSHTVEGVPFFGTRMWISPHDFVRDVRSGVYIKFPDEEIITICAGAGIKTPEFVSMEESDLIDSEKGTDSIDSAGYTPARKWIECYRWEGWWALNETDESNVDRYLLTPTQYAVWVAVRSRRIIKIARLEDLNKDGKRSPVKFDFISEPNRFYSIGLAEWVRHIQAELDAIHNQRLDAGLLVNVPWGFYKPQAGFSKELIRIKPGVFQPTADPSSVNMPQANWQPVWSFQEEGLVRKYGGEQAGLTDPAVGSFTTKRQSASEFVGTTSAIDLRTGEIVEQILDSVRELLYRIIGLYQQFSPRKRVFQIAGENGAYINKEFEVDRLQGKIYLKLCGNLQQTDQALQQQIALDMLQILMNQILIQSGIVDQETIYCAVQKLVEANNYEGVPIHKPDMPPRSDSPQNENRQMMAGVKPRGPTENENFSEHLQAHLQFATDPKFESVASQETMQLLADHIKATTQMQMVVAQMRKIQAAQAVQLQQMMIAKGINPGGAGGAAPGQGAGPGTPEEGAGNPAASTNIGASDGSQQLSQ